MGLFFCTPYLICDKNRANARKLLIYKGDYLIPRVFALAGVCVYTRASQQVGRGYARISKARAGETFNAGSDKRDPCKHAD